MNLLGPAAAVAALALLGGCTREAPIEEARLTPAWVERFESSIELKETLARHGGALLETYARHYRTVRVDGVTRVEAVYVPPLKRQPDDMRCVNGGGEPIDCGPGPSESELRRHGPGVHIDEPPRGILDGGCSMVTMLIEPATLEVTTARCNGR